MQKQTNVTISTINLFTFNYNNVNYKAKVNKNATTITITNATTEELVNKITKLEYYAGRLNYNCKQQDAIHNIVLNTFLYICNNFDNLETNITVNNNVLNY